MFGNYGSYYTRGLPGGGRGGDTGADAVREIHRHCTAPYRVDCLPYLIAQRGERVSPSAAEITIETDQLRFAYTFYFLSVSLSPFVSV